MSPKNITLSVAVIVIAMFVGMVTQPFSKTQPHTELLAKIESAESFRDEAKALALSMPLLPDTLIISVADSLLATLVTLNRDWVIFVLTEEGFEDYTDDIEELNKSLESIRMDYEIAKTLRKMDKRIKDLKDWQKRWDKKSKKRWDKESKKYET